MDYVTGGSERNHSVPCGPCIERGGGDLRETLGQRHEEVHLEEKQGGDTVAWHSVEG